MKLYGQRLLRIHQRKHKGNRPLSKAIDKLVDDFESSSIESPKKLLELRSDAERVHSGGFYFFNLKQHRTMVLVEFENDESTILWCGDHDSYEKTFKNNKNTIRKWLKSKDLI